MDKKRKNGSKKALKSFAYSQIFSLVLAMIAFAFFFSQVGSVNAQSTRTPPTVTKPVYTPFGQTVVGARFTQPTSLGSISVPAGLEGTLEGNTFTITKLPDDYRGTLGVGGTLNLESTNALQLEPVMGDIPQPAPAPPAERGFWIFKSSQPFYGHLFEGLSWAFTAITVVQLVGRLAGMDDDEVNSLSMALGGGIIAGKAAMGAVQQWGTGKTFMGMSSGTVGFVTGAAIGLFILYQTYKKKSQKIVTLQCNPWEPPLGGENCEKCNSGDYPCSEYRCKSLGQACELLNPETEEAKCAWVSRDDVTSPTIDIMPSAIIPL